MRTKVLGLLAVGLLAQPMTANATTVVTAPCGASPFYCVTEIKGLNVDGVVLDVSPAFGDIADIPEANFFIGNRNGAGGAANGILVALQGVNVQAVVIGEGLTFNVAVIAYGIDQLVAGYEVGPGGDVRERDNFGQHNPWWTFRAIPEPGSLALLGLALAGLGVSRRRRPS